MEVEYLSIPVDENKDKAIMDKSLTGKFPMLELQDGKTHICESLSIARYLSQDKYGFYGPDAADKARTE